MNTKIKYITDGDVSGAIYVVDKKSPVDIYLGIGGGPEGVIVAAALSCYGGQMQGRLILDENEIIRAKKLGIVNFKKKYNISDMVKGDVIFCASGVTNGDLADGIKVFDDNFKVSTLALHKSQKINKLFTNTYKK